ncbi:tetratricopeptide repeat protein [Campylobacter concisus]|uniref:tetratricopeptide repeat protein n=1 Tax=Campylobacter concisus TaxID=199 RepID=UPI000D302E5C|nr:tetratricopeptide repeat protein [Campylobacter concisus]
MKISKSVVNLALKAKNRKLHRSYIYIYLDKNERDKMADMTNKSCELGNPHSCLFLGNIYLQKDTPAQEKEEGLRLYNKACELKNAFACYTLALIYKTGDTGMLQDKNRAKNYYKKACELDLEEACSMLKNFN